ncbi:hypothetical protein D3C76_762250 [compost metagenome]
MVATGEYEALGTYALGSLQQVQGGMVVGLNRGLELDICAVSTCQVKYRVHPFGCLADEVRIGQVADKRGFPAHQVSDGAAIQQAQVETFAQVRTQCGSDDTGGAGDKKRKHGEIPKSCVVQRPGGAGPPGVASQAVAGTVACFSGFLPTNKATISAPRMPRPAARPKPLA